MVEGLKAGRPLVKFRRVLPLAELLFVAASTYRYYRFPPRMVRGPGPGVELVLRLGTPPATVAAAVNLPAGVVALPLEMAVRLTDAPHSPYYDVFRIVEFSLLGVIFWYFAGRFMDDAIAWRALRSGSRWRLSDCLMAALIAAESTLVLFALRLMPGLFMPSAWFLLGALGWALLGYSALVFRVLQFRAYPRIKNRRNSGTTEDNS